jgi:urate oxidase
MHLTSHSYGKGRVRIMRVARETVLHEVRELSIKVMLTGDFAASFTSNDNSKVIATDTIKNIVNIVARDNPALETEDFVRAIAKYFFDHYSHVDAVDVDTLETKWDRLIVNGKPHDHAFKMDANGKPTCRLTASRTAHTLSSGITGFTFLKSTGSGWVKYYMDEATTLPETEDRIFSTAMDASWRWERAPVSFPGATAQILDTMMDIFATTYSPSVQNSLYLMAGAALRAVPEIGQISLACPNKHYLPINMAPFKRDNPNVAFTPTDEPHGQIECTVTRSS